jgi:hypothetical protein
MYPLARRVYEVAGAAYGLDSAVLLWTEVEAVPDGLQPDARRPLRLRMARRIDDVWHPATTVTELPTSNDNLVILSSIHPGDEGLALVGYTESRRTGSEVVARWFKQDAP